MGAHIILGSQFVFLFLYQIITLPRVTRVRSSVRPVWGLGMSECPSELLLPPIGNRIMSSFPRTWERQRLCWGFDNFYLPWTNIAQPFLNIFNSSCVLPTPCRQLATNHRYWSDIAPPSLSLGKLWWQEFYFVRLLVVTHLLLLLGPRSCCRSVPKGNPYCHLINIRHTSITSLTWRTIS